MAPNSPYRGFTLVELLIVIAVIGLLAMIAIVSLGSSRARSRDTKRASDLAQIKKALDLSYEPGSGYPLAGAPIVIGTATTDVLCERAGATGFKPDQTPANCDANRVFMGLVPANPSPGGTSYMYQSTDALGASCATAPCNGYCLQATLESGVGSSGLSAGAIIATQSGLRNGTCL
ncbi:MAG: type II secretion system protein [Patescibacteria group bacterium]|nr:MAG: type II secretion system protein [Patescibacteria group bacterium]